MPVSKTHRFSDHIKAAIILRWVVSHRQADWSALACVIPFLEGRTMAAHEREAFNSEARRAAEALGEETLIICGYLPKSTARKRPAAKP